MILHENRLPADVSHEISCLICYFQKSVKILNCRLLQIMVESDGNCNPTTTCSDTVIQNQY